MALQITPLPPAPQRSQPADFVVKADAHVASLTGFVDETNAVATELNGFADSAETDAATASASALSAAANANYVGEWSTQVGALNIPASVSHNDTSWQLTANLADVTASEPGVTSDWLALTGSTWKDPKTASFNIAAGNSYLVDGSSGTVDGSLPATIVTKQEFIVHNETISTNLVRVLNPNFTIKGAKGVLAPGDNLILEPGDTVKLVARSSTILEVV